MTEQTEIIMHDIWNFGGIEVEKSDRSVGIMDDDFCIWGLDNNKRQVELHFGTEEFLRLLNKITPFIEEEKSRIELENKMEKEASN